MSNQSESFSVSFSIIIMVTYRRYFGVRYILSILKAVFSNPLYSPLCVASPRIAKDAKHVDLLLGMFIGLVSRISKSISGHRACKGCFEFFF